MVTKGIIFIFLFVVSCLFFSAAFIMYVLDEKKQVKGILKNWVLFMVTWGIFALVSGIVTAIFS